MADQTQKQLPIKVNNPQSVHGIRGGMKILVPTDSTGLGLGLCTNCNDPDGMFWYWKVIGPPSAGKGYNHLFTDNKKGQIELRARLFSAPCPVCRPDVSAPPPPAEEPEERKPYYD